MNRNKWAKLIKERDNYACVKCGSNEKIEAHHIIPASVSFKKEYDLENGIALCHNCHEKEHIRLRSNRIVFSFEISEKLCATWEEKLKADKLTKIEFVRETIAEYLGEKAD